MRRNPIATGKKSNYSNKRLIEIFEQKIKDKINEVWGVKEEKKYILQQDECLMVAEDNL